MAIATKIHNTDILFRSLLNIWFMQARHIEFLQLLNGDVQYIVPRWQRRYCWQESDINRLVEDLLAIAQDDDDQSTHYAGTLLTFPETGAAGVLSRIRVVDGQQRLTTVSILLGCIAEKLDQGGRVGDWTSAIIRDRRLTNPHMDRERELKLQLQNEDSDEYRSGLAGNPTGPGAVAQAWRTTQSLVNKSNTTMLLRGLERLRVVSIGLDSHDDPQQIFESINATGRPLTESEKVKNWLLIGLPEEEQRELHDESWKRIETALGARYSSNPIDIFLRDVMRWYTGEKVGANQTFEEFRRWAIKLGKVDRPSLCREFARLAELYGFLTGTRGPHPNKSVETELRHLRDMGIDVHRPLSLRVLSDSFQSEASTLSVPQLIQILHYISTWITRMWLAGRSFNALGTAFMELAHARSKDDDDYCEFLYKRICKLRGQAIAVPGDDAVREGIRSRKAYGGSASNSAKAILCELMEEDHGSEAPNRSDLTLEHIMPQKLTSQWKNHLGENAEEIHRDYRNQLANLTLCGEEINISMGANSFGAKKLVYQRSSIAMTRTIATEDSWSVAAMSRRSDYISERVLSRWVWEDDGEDHVEQSFDGFFPMVSRR